MNTKFVEPVTCQTTVIALCGPAGSGKSSVADYLIEKYGAQRYGFTTPLKEMVRKAFDLTWNQVYGTQEQKEAVDPRYNHSARWLLQRIGTEGCRATFGEDFWTKQCLDMIHRQNQRIAVIDDMRFFNESEAVLHDSRVNGYVFRLWPVGDSIALERAEAAGSHSSEAEWKSVNASLEIQPQKRSLEELFSLVDVAMRDFVVVRPNAGGMAW
jgi:hypothetical protein